MKRYIWLLTLALPIISIAQAARLSMPDFKELEAKATESVNITLDGDMLKSAGSFLGGGSGNAARDAETAELMKDIQGIYIRVFSFDQPNMFSPSVVEPVLRQTQAPGWKSLMTIRGKDERVEMWMHERNSGGGFLLVVTEPKELVIVNIIGNIDLQKLGKLQGRMGVPNLPGVPGPSPPSAPPPPAPPATP